MPEETVQAGQGPVMKSGHRLFTPVGLGLLALLFGILLPPVGLFFAIWGLYKAGKYSNKLALVLSVIAIIAVASASTFYVWVYNDHQTSGKNLTATYKYPGYSDFKLVGLTKGRGMSFKKPDGFTATIDSHNITQSSLIQKVKLPSYSNLVTVSSIDAQIATPGESINDAYIAKTNAAMTQQNSDYTSYKNAATSYLLKSVYSVPAANLTLSTPKSFTSDNLKANAWTYDYTIKSTFDDGTSRDITGKLLFALGAKDVYYFSISSLTPNWNANTSTWDTVFKSVKIDQ
jgi:hypothetical protein